MKKVLDFYEKIIGWLEIAFNLLIVGVIGLQIITRFFFNLPLKFPEEVSAFVLIAMVFAGVSVVERHNEHLRVEFLQDLLPAKGKKPDIWQKSYWKQAPRLIHTRQKT